MITIPITFRMLIAKYLCLLKPFWLRKNNKTSVLLIIIILAMILGVVKIQVWLNDWNNDFFNALSQKETDKLWQLVLWFPALLGIFVLISVNKTWLIKLLTIRWREWLTITTLIAGLQIKTTTSRRSTVSIKIQITLTNVSLKTFSY